MRDPFLSAPYVDDLLHQPEALRDTLAALAGADFAPLAEFGDRLRRGSLRRVVLTGMGASFHALHPLLLGLLARGLPAQMMETAELVHHASGLLSADTLVVAVSQSGASAETLRLLERTPRPVLAAVTNTPGSPLAGAAGALLLTRAGSETTVSCKTYLAALAALAVLEALLTGADPAETLAGLQGLPEAVAGYFSGLEGYLDLLAGPLAGVTYLALVGRGASLAAAGAGGLIVKEAAHFPAEGMSSAAFRHGPLEMASPQTFVLVYEGRDPTRALNRGLAADIREAGGKAALVESSPELGVFHLPTAPAVGLPILEMLPAQVLSLALARLHGRIPGRFSHGSKVTTRE
ncbi:MAG TPA: SIS domain-containing protein [Anaerolineales bacterium]|nr:SIS domain-containing protein [Anaerolineales bacterium]